MALEDPKITQRLQMEAKVLNTIHHFEGQRILAPWSPLPCSQITLALLLHTRCVHPCLSTPAQRASLPRAFPIASSNALLPCGLNFMWQR